MRRTLVWLLLLLYMALPLSAKTLGYGLGLYGQSVVQQVEASSSGVELSLVYQPWLFTIGNPSLQLKAAMGEDMDGVVVFPYVEIGLSMDIFRTIRHPFNFYANNMVAFDPAVSVAYHFGTHNTSHLLSVGFSPFKFSQKDFWYEFFAFYVAMDLGTGTVDNWGINLVRYTYIFK